MEEKKTNAQGLASDTFDGGLERVKSGSERGGHDDISVRGGRRNGLRQLDTERASEELRIGEDSCLKQSRERGSDCRTKKRETLHKDGKRSKEKSRKRGDVSSSISESDTETESAKSSDSETLKGRKKRNSGRKKPRLKFKGKKQVSDSDSESSEESGLDRRDKTERSGHKSRDRRVRKKDKSKHRKKKREESDSDVETSSGREDRREDRRKRKRRKESEREEKRKRKKREKKDRGGDGGFVMQEAEGDGKETAAEPPISQQEAARRVAEDAKRVMRQNAEVARARLAGEVEAARVQQMALQNQFGAVDQRAVKKLNAEKRKLKSMVKATQKLEALEAKEAARMDAFRVAMGLPTAEAQRQAEWRAEATQQAAYLNATSAQEPPTPRRTLGPQLPGSKPKAMQ